MAGRDHLLPLGLAALEHANYPMRRRCGSSSSHGIAHPVMNARQPPPMPRIIGTILVLCISARTHARTRNTYMEETLENKGNVGKMNPKKACPISSVVKVMQKEPPPLLH